MIFTLLTAATLNLQCGEIKSFKVEGDNCHLFLDERELTVKESCNSVKEFKEYCDGGKEEKIFKESDNNYKVHIRCGDIKEYSLPILPAPGCLVYLEEKRKKYIPVRESCSEVKKFIDYCKTIPEKPIKKSSLF